MLRWTGPRVDIRTVVPRYLRFHFEGRGKGEMRRDFHERSSKDIYIIYIVIIFLLFSFRRQVESAAPVDQISPGEGNTKRRKKVSGEIFLPRTSVVPKNFGPRDAMESRSIRFSGRESRQTIIVDEAKRKESRICHSGAFEIARFARKSKVRSVVVCAR